MVDAEDLKSFGHCDRVGSSPTIPTTFRQRDGDFLFDRDGCVAQLVRALRSHRRGRWFESNHIHHVFILFPLERIDTVDMRDIIPEIYLQLGVFMLDWVQKIFMVKNVARENAVKQNCDSFGEVTLRDMVRRSFSDDLIFHGSPARLQPGYDIIKPGFLKHSDNCVYAGDIATAIRFALVRAWGNDQYGGTDFYVYCTRRYRLVIYNVYSLGDDWYNRDIDTDAYVYAIAAKGVSLDNVNSTYKALPIAGRAIVNQRELARAGFWFVPEVDFSTMRWWGIRNTEENIQKYVLPAFPWLYKRQR